MILEIAIAAGGLSIGRWLSRRIPRREHMPRALRLAEALPVPWSFAAAVRDGDVTIHGDCSRCGLAGGVSFGPQCGGGSRCRGLAVPIPERIRRPIALPIAGPGVPVRR